MQTRTFAEIKNRLFGQASGPGPQKPAIVNTYEIFCDPVLPATPRSKAPVVPMFCRSQMASRAADLRQQATRKIKP